jgi:uncharacterized protein YkwD
MLAMRSGLLGAVLLAVMVPSGAPAETPFEREVLASLNFARANPGAYARGLDHYRTYFRANLVRYPGLKPAIVTNEGVAPVKEAMAVLASQEPLVPLQSSARLAASASDLVADQARGGEGHVGNDGSSPSDRLRRHGGGIYVAEVIAYGPVDAADVVRQLIVDDGVADRGHRTLVYSPDLRYAGVSCGSHPVYRTVCVIDLGITADGREPNLGMRIASR